MATAAELLAETNTAISACLASQSYSVAERSQQRAQLAQLTAFRKELLGEVQENRNGGQMASLIQVGRPI